MTPRNMLQPEADVLLAIHSLRHRLDSNRTKVICRHIYVHQDSCRQPTPVIFDDTKMSCPSSSTSTSDSATTFSTHALTSTHQRLDLPRQINIGCDRLATEMSTAVLSHGVTPTLLPTLAPPLPGSHAMLRISDNWITSHHCQHIHWEHHAYALWDYCMTKYGWDNDTFDSIDWDVIKRVRSHCTSTQQMQTSKILHDWLPVMHMMSHMTSNTQCPGCSCTNETIQHLLHCPHLLMKAKRDEIVAALQKEGLKAHLPWVLLGVLSDYILGTITANTLIDATRRFHHSLAAQARIGVNHLLRGFIANNGQ